MGFLALCRRLTNRLTIALLLFVPAAALVVLLWPQSPTDVLHRLARIPLFAVAFCTWGILSAAIARKARWSPRACRSFAALTVFAACFLFWFASSKDVFLAVLPGAFAVGLFCRKLVYPELGWNDLDGGPQGLISLHLNS
jgi:hypothetical protein